MALLGDSEMCEYEGEGGIRRRRRALVGVRAGLREADRRGADRRGESADEDERGAGVELCLSVFGK